MRSRQCHCQRCDSTFQKKVIGGPPPKWCRDCLIWVRREQASRGYRLNREKILARNRARYAQNPGKDRLRHLEYRKRNLETLKKKWRTWDARARKSNPAYRLGKYLRSRIWSALRGLHKSSRTLGLLGCSVEFLRGHLEKRFQTGMTWENYGPVWHVDHIKPCASFDLSDPAQQRECFHFSNLQPLLARENIRKGAKT